MNLCLLPRNQIIQTLSELAQFFYRQAGEERTHAMKIVHFLLETGCKPIIPTTPEAIYSGLKTTSGGTRSTTITRRTLQDNGETSPGARPILRLIPVPWHSISAALKVTPPYAARLPRRL